MTYDEALALACRHAASGLPTFPAAISWDDRKKATNKRPVCEGGFHSATTDPDRLAALFEGGRPWMQSHETWAVGACPGAAGYVVVDIDCKNGKDGYAGIAPFDLPPTYTVKTPSGGEHRWFRKVDVTHIGNVWEQGNGPVGVEIRSDAGFIIAPGVETKWGSWTTFDDFAHDVAVCPNNLWVELAPRAQHRTGQTGGGVTSPTMTSPSCTRPPGLRSRSWSRASGPSPRS